MVMQLQPGDPARIGRYRLLGQLGAGGMGRVLRGVGPDGRLVAVKQVHAHLVTESDFLPRFRREVRVSARVSGAFAAAVVDFDVESEEPWLASVFVPGVPLDKAVEQFGPLSTDQVRTLALGLASALHAIHEVGLIHRDLKPANVILAEDGPRVIDFGIARAVEGRSELTHTGSTRPVDNDSSCAWRAWRATGTTVRRARRHRECAHASRSTGGCAGRVVRRGPIHHCPATIPVFRRLRTLRCAASRHSTVGNQATGRRAVRLAGEFRRPINR